MITNNNTSHVVQCDLSSLVSKIDTFIFAMISFASIVGHSIIFTAYTRHRVLRNTTNVFLISLSASDVIVAVLSVPFSFGVFLCQVLPAEDESTTYNYIYRYIDMLPSVLSIYSLTLVAIDRAVAVSLPFVYRRCMSQKSACITVIVTWVVVSVIVLMEFVMALSEFTLLAIILAYVIPVTIMIVSYVIIGYVAKKHAKEINQLERTASRIHQSTSSMQSSASSTGVRAANHNSMNNVQDHNLLQDENTSTITKDALPDARKTPRSGVNVSVKCLWRELKSAVKLSFILSCFVISWTPFMVLNMMQYRCNFCSIDINVVKYFKLLHYSNSALNPVLYILLNKAWKRAFKMTVCCTNREREGRLTYNSSLGW